MIAAVKITAASRLHFGLIAWGSGVQRQFGGAGVMVAPPTTTLELAAASHFSVAGKAAERVAQFAAAWQRFVGQPRLPPYRFTVTALPDSHVGLGSGTQLGLCVARALYALHGTHELSANTLAASVGRGLRSAVGTHGFLKGGLIIDQGQSGPQSLGTLRERCEFPSVWRFVLILLPPAQAISGDAELQAFAKLPDVPDRHSDRLWREIDDQLLPAARAAEFDRFSESLYRFGRDAGLNFAPIQGGPYHGPHVTALVNRLRELGVRGVGQSSWGPTVFALCPNQDRATELAARLHSEPAAAGAQIGIAAPWNQGAILRVQT
ncbi:MAG: hypothetical protein AB7F89_01800 [Pirellulaceae bacterium]